MTESRKTQPQLDPTPNGPNPEWTQLRMDPAPNRLNPKSTQPWMVSIPKGLNPEWIQPRRDWTLKGPNPELTQPWKDSIPTATQPRMGSGLNGLNPDCYLVPTGTQPWKGLDLESLLTLNGTISLSKYKILLFLRTWMKVYLYQKNTRIKIKFFITGVEIVGHSRLRGIRGWKIPHSEFSPFGGWVPFGVESILLWFPFGVKSILCWVPFWVQSIRGWVPFGVEYHSEFSPFRV